MSRHSIEVFNRLKQQGIIQTMVFPMCVGLGAVLFTCLGIGDSMQRSGQGYPGDQQHNISDDTLRLNQRARLRLAFYV